MAAVIEKQDETKVDIHPEVEHPFRISKWQVAIRK